MITLRHRRASPAASGNINHWSNRPFPHASQAQAATKVVAFTAPKPHTQATIGLINNQGDLGKTLEQLGSENNLKSIATTMLTAGAMQGLGGQIKLDVPDANGIDVATRINEIKAAHGFGVNSPYAWNTASTTTPARTAWTSNGPVPITSGEQTLRYGNFSANGQTYSLPVADCPAALCTNGDPIARFGISEQDAATLAAYDAAKTRELAKDASTAGLVVGTAVALPATALGTAAGGGIVGAGSYTADQTIDGKPVNGTELVTETVKGAVIGVTGYGVVKGLGVADDVLSKAATKADDAAALEAALAAQKIENNFYAEGASTNPVGLQTSAGVIAPNPNKTTTVLGRWAPDMKGVIGDAPTGATSQMEPGSFLGKSTDFGAKPGGFNVLNVPAHVESAAGNQFFDKVNKPFLDQALKRGDDVALATVPQKVDDIMFSNGQLKGNFAYELDYLVRNNYKPVNVTSTQWESIKGWFK